MSEPHDHYRNEHDEPETEYVSKSQLKREMEALQVLGRELMDLKEEQLDRLPMSERLVDAIRESDRIRKREARRRHVHYLARLLSEEPELEALERAVEAIKAGSAEHTRRHHLAEQWRERLIEDGKDTVSEFVRYCPDVDVQHLRNLVRNAQRERQANKNTGQAKKLFRFLREAIDIAEG